MNAILTPSEIRARLVSAYTQSFARAFGFADRSVIERKVDADLQLVEAAKHAPAPRSSGRRRRSPRVGAAAVAEAESLKFAKDARPGGAFAFRPGFLHNNPLDISERWGAAVARIGRILQGSRGATLTECAKNAEAPKLAARFLEVFAFYMTRSKAPPPGVDHNPFRTLSDADASRLFMRKVEDIADASTGSLGSWYTPK